MIKKRYKQFLYLLLLIFTSINSLYSQSDCYNSDFSAGNFTGWTGYYGGFRIPYIEGIVPDLHHTIINVSSIDPYTCGGLLTIPSGESYSARLGSETAGAQTEKLVYNISVSNQNNLFIYKYAVVLQDGEHILSTQPKFSVRILNSEGHEIDPTCGVYKVSSGEPDQNFQKCNDIYWTQWNTVGIDLSNYIGQNVSIEFGTKDCPFGEHFGYAYISAKCSRLKANIIICSGGNNFTLNAPTGFAAYLWSYQGQTIGTNQNITLPLANYPLGAIFECNLTSYNNGNKCESKIQAVLVKPITINPIFSASFPCNNNHTTFNPISFINETSFVNGTVDEWNWDFGDGTTSNEQNPNHVFLNSGTYTITLKATSVTGCLNSISKNIIIDNNPIPIPMIDGNQKFCSYPIPTIANINTNGQNLKWFNSITSINPLADTTELTDANTYYCSFTSNGCLGPKTAFFVSLKNTPPLTGSTIQNFCLIDNPKISDLKVSGNSILWYVTQTGGIPLNPTTLLNNDTYYASQTDSQTACESVNRLPVKAIIHDNSANLPEDYNQEFCLKENLTIKDLNINGENIMYYETINSNNQLSPEHPLINGTTYYASIIDPITNCESLKRTAITAVIKPCELTVFNTISINNNGLNDYFIIKNIEYFPENTVEIYNRFGQLVYKSSKYGIDNNYFYGDSNAGEVYKKNKKLPTGTYFYIINYKNESTPINRIQKGFLYINNNE